MPGLIARVATAFGLAGGAVALGVAGMTVTSVALRALWARPIQGDIELTQFGIALAIALAIPWCQLRGANIIVDFFTQRLPQRRQRALDGVGALLLAAMLALLAWRAMVAAEGVRAAGETSMIRGLPMWWVYASLSPGLALAALIAALQAIGHLRGAPLATLASEETG